MDRQALYLAFARSFVGRFADRVIGVDDASLRLVGTRPSDHVLGGFLTAAKHSRETDGETVEDLPDDSPYEQSAIGLEWLAQNDGLRHATAHVTVSLSLYVRMIPTFEEQGRHCIWRSDRSEGAGTKEPETELAQVWQRVDLCPLVAAVDLDVLWQRRKLVSSLAVDIQQAWKPVRESLHGRYERSSGARIPRSAFTREGFAAWCASLAPTAPREDWTADLDVRLTAMPTVAGHSRVSLRIINRTGAPDGRGSAFFDPNLYAARIAVEVPNCAHANGLFRELEQSYRYDLSLPAIGINAHPVVERAKESVVLRTDAVPRQEAARLEPRTISEVEPTFEGLSKDPVPILRKILNEMRNHDRSDWAGKVAQLSGDQLAEAVHDRERFGEEIQAFERGINLLASPEYPAVRSAFQLMNEAMGDVASGKGLAVGRPGPQRLYRAWHLFQVVFIVSQLPALASREHLELARPGDDRVEVLWFAAGGGKTEAFLGLLVWHAFFDRLRGKRFGTMAMVRFPLRLLAFQQLQRMARTLAAADVIRQRERLPGDAFSLGYYVGGTQTPNSIDADRHSRYTREGIDRRELRLSECPYCGSEVAGHYEGTLRLIEHRCSNASCPTRRGRLPLYIVDRDVERFLPTVVVATVDKLAQLGQQQRFANIFGRISMLCGRHGASFLDTERAQCPAAEALSGAPRMSECGGHAVLYPPFHDLGPALLVQDELHLLSEELGTFDAHYETAVMKLSETLGFRPWKIIGATATITHFERHAQQLYLKGSKQFPAPGPEAFRSFYYAAEPGKVARIFVGVLGVGRKHTPAVTRVLSLVYQELQEARDRAAVDLAGACVRYGIPELSREEFERLIFYYELALTYVLTRKGSDQVAEAIESRVKRELAESSPEAGDLRVETFNGSVDMGEMIQGMRRIERADPTANPSDRTRGLVTTNIIGHGVDVERFNIIVFAGFTRLVAEYIQASARVGRRYPGISILVVTPQSERDRSIYQRFAKFHEYLDRLVDPSAVNRWPVPALRRTVPGLLAGYMMGGAAAKMDRRLESVDRVQGALGRAGSEPINADAVVAWMQEALGSAGRPGYSDDVDRIVRNAYALIVNTKPSSSYLQNLLNVRLQSMRSLRDVDEPADVTIETAEDLAIMKGLRRA